MECIDTASVIVSTKPDVAPRIKILKLHAPQSERVMFDNPAQEVLTIVPNKHNSPLSISAETPVSAEQPVALVVNHHPF